MKTTFAVLALVVTILAPTVSMANISDYESYIGTYPVSQGQTATVQDVQK